MKTPRRTTGVRKEQRMPESNDAYRLEAKPSYPVRCASCGATYRNGRWSWEAAPADARSQTCPACERIADDVAGGFLTLRGPFAATHRAEVLALVHEREQREKDEHPLQRIMSISAGSEGLVIKTTDPHLARGIAHALHDAFKGALDLDWNESERRLRAVWTR